MATEEKFGRACRELMLKEMRQALSENPNFIITNYLGLSVSDLENLRKKLRKSSARYIVVKNSICKRTFDALKLSDLVRDINGGIGLGLLGEDAILSFKVIVDFAKEKDALKIRSGYVDGERLDIDTIKRIASLPPRDVLLSMVLQAMKGPISGFVSVLGGVIRKFLYTINAIKEKKEKGGN